MELRHLRYFLAVAELRHFRKAARRLHISQPTLSQQVHQLEEELGAPLFERLPTGVRLTQAGEVFVSYASRALEDVYGGQRAVGALTGLAAGHLRVGYPPSARGLVMPAVAAVLRRHPGVQIVSEEGVARRVERRVVEGKLDVGLSYAPLRSPQVEAEPLREMRLRLVVPAGHGLSADGTVTLARLRDEPFALLARGTRVRAAVDAYFARGRFSPRLLFEANAVATVLAVVREGLAVTVLPEPLFVDSEGLPTLRLSPSPAAPLAVLVWRRGAPRSPPAAALADEIQRRVRARS